MPRELKIAEGRPSEIASSKEVQKAHISTQCVEAGVDIDFPDGFEECPLLSPCPKSYFIILPPIIMSWRLSSSH